MKKGASGVKEKVVISSIKESFKAIKDKKLYFGILFISQLLMIIILSAIFVHYAIRIGDNMQAIIEPLQDLSTTMTPEDAALMLGDSEALDSAYSMMKSNIAMMILFLFISYVLLGGINWDIANLMVNDPKGSFVRYQVMFGAAVSFFTFVAVLFSGVFLRLLSYVGNVQIARLLVLILVVGISYFSFISFALIHEHSAYKMKQAKQLIRQTVRLGCKKFGTLFFSYCFMVLINLLFGGVVYLLLYSHMLALLFSLIFFILSLNWGKLFFLITVRKSEGNGCILCDDGIKEQRK